MLTLEFSENWNNKLSCTAFTTLRLSGRYQVGDTVEIYFKNKRMGFARCVYKKAIRFDDLNDAVCYVDTGYSAIETKNIIKKMYPKQTFFGDEIIFFYVFKYEKKRNNTTQQNLFDNKQIELHN